MQIMEIVSQWYNAIFAVIFCTGLIYALVYAFLGHGDEIGSDISHDAEIDHDVDHDFEHDIEHDHDSDMEHGAGVENNGILIQALSFLGVGRCPISIIFIVLFMTWGFTGITANAFFLSMKIVPYQIYFWFSLAIATIVSVLVTRYLSMLVAKMIPRTESSAVELSSLVGKYGEAKVSIDRDGGSARVKDQHGTQHIIYCITKNDKPIGVNNPIIVLQYLSEKEIFVVAKKPEILTVS